MSFLLQGLINVKPPQNHYNSDGIYSTCISKNKTLNTETSVSSHNKGRYSEKSCGLKVFEIPKAQRSTCWAPSFVHHTAARFVLFCMSKYSV